MAKIDFGKVMLEISNNLTTREPGTALDAVQGYELDGKIQNLKEKVDNNTGESETVNRRLNELTTAVNGKAATSHASTGTGYGMGNSGNYGHVKLSDNYTSSAGSASGGVGASSLAVYNAYNTLNNNKLSTGGGTLKGNLNTAALYPTGNNSYNIGSTSNQYMMIYGTVLENYNNGNIQLKCRLGSTYIRSGGLSVVNYDNTAHVAVRASKFDSSSDIRKKKNIQKIQPNESLNIIQKITPIGFRYKNNEKQQHRGFSAQEIEKVLTEYGMPEQIYSYDLENDEYFLDKSELIPDLVNCIQYLIKENSIIQTKLESLDKMVNPQ